MKDIKNQVLLGSLHYNITKTCMNQNQRNIIIKKKKEKKIEHQSKTPTEKQASREKFECKHLQQYEDKNTSIEI